jgi:hypothetical protein
MLLNERDPNAYRLDATSVQACWAALEAGSKDGNIAEAVRDDQRALQTGWAPSSLQPLPDPNELPHLKCVATSSGGPSHSQ